LRLAGSWSKRGDMRTGPRIVSVLLIASIGFASPVVAAEGGWPTAAGSAWERF